MIKYCSLPNGKRFIQNKIKSSPSPKLDGWKYILYIPTAYFNSVRSVFCSST